MTKQEADSNEDDVLCDEEDVMGQSITILRRVYAKRWIKAGNVCLVTGSFGAVHLAMNLDGGSQFALKEIDASPIAQPAVEHTNSDTVVNVTEGSTARLLRGEKLTQLCTELRVMEHLRHPNIVVYLGHEFSTTKRKLYIFMEYVAGGTILDALQRYGPLSLHVTQSYVRDIIDGLMYLHENNVVHRDIKPSNILVNQTGRCKIGDFGLAKMMGEVDSHLRNGALGTLVYAPPEMFTTYFDRKQVNEISGADIPQYDPITPKFDIWSLCVSIHEMLTGSCFGIYPSCVYQSNTSIIQYLYKMGRGPHTPIRIQERGNLDQYAINLIEMGLQVSVDDRCSLDEMTSHDFFQQDYAYSNDDFNRDRNGAVLKLEKLHDGLTLTVSTGIMMSDGHFPTIDREIVRWQVEEDREVSEPDPQIHDGSMGAVSVTVSEDDYPPHIPPPIQQAERIDTASSIRWTATSTCSTRRTTL